MKSRIPVFIVIGLFILALGIMLFTASTRNQEPLATFPATINRDCAPWDGSAFTISLPYDARTTITVSIWQAPGFPFPVIFSFPDETMSIGVAYTLPEPDQLEELTGEITFRRVEQGIPVAGEFDLTSARGEQFKGKFIADWRDELVYCG